MQLSKVIWLYVSLTAVILQSFTLPMVLIGFKLNKEYIASELCVNRDIPESGCNGQCYLMKKLKQAGDNDQGAEKPAVKRETFWQHCTALIKRTTLLPLRSVLLAPSGKVHYTFLSSFSIFHPPRTA